MACNGRAAVAACLRNERRFLPWEEIRWLVDPPEVDYGYPALRQWQFAFAELPAGVRVSFFGVRREGRVEELLSVVTERAGEAAFEFVTTGEMELQVRHDRETIERGRVKQRWLLPTKLIAAGRSPVSIMRSGTKLGVVSRDGLMTFDLASGKLERRAGRFELARQNAGKLVAVETRSFALGEAGLQAYSAREARAAGEGRSSVPAPFSVTLPGGRVAALHADQLVIAIPYGQG